MDFSYNFFKVLGERDVSGTVVRDGNSVVYSFNLKHGPILDQWRHRGGVRILLNCIQETTTVVEETRTSVDQRVSRSNDKIYFAYPPDLPVAPAQVSVKIEVTPDGGKPFVQHVLLGRDAIWQNEVHGAVTISKPGGSYSFTLAWPATS
jgi:sarcosine oxidase delta subunit